MFSPAFKQIKAVANAEIIVKVRSNPIFRRLPCRLMVSTPVSAAMNLLLRTGLLLRYEMAIVNGPRGPV
jgi:hypothetical protein